MNRPAVFFAIVISVFAALSAQAQNTCTLVNELSCPAALKVGESGPCTLTTRNVGSTSCSGTIYTVMIGFAEADLEQTGKFSGTTGSLAQCIDAIPGLPEFEFAYCFGEGSVGPGQTLTVRSTFTVLKDPPTHVVQVMGVGLVADAEFNLIGQTEPAIANIAVGESGCTTPRATRISAPGTVEQKKSDQLTVTVIVEWLALPGVSSYELEESTTPDFANPNRRRVNATTASFDYDATRESAHYYRVRGIADCNQSTGEFSNAVRTVVKPLPPATGNQFDVTTPEGSTDPIVFQIFVPHPAGAAKQTQQTGFTASTDKGFLTVTPSSGTIPPAGTTLTVTANPGGLPPGSSTGTVTVTNSTTGAPITNVPVTVSLVTPVTPAGKTAPPPNTLIVPVVAHLDSANSRFQSDVRLSNVSVQSVGFRLAFTPSNSDGTQIGSQTTFQVDADQTIALNDILKNAFGLAVFAGEGAGGSLEIRPLEQVGIPGAPPPQVNLVASSRTYAVTPNGTLGQFIPAIPFSEFIGPGSTLSLQQVAESDDYRTNVGFVEGSGQPASLLVRVISGSGQTLGEFPVNLSPFEHRQINRFMRERNITLTDGRIEVQVVSATGRVTAYASVLDNKTDDPLLVSPVVASAMNESRYIIPGVADLNNALASWRTDIRIFNSSATSLRATLTFHPQGQPTASRSTEITVLPGEVRAVDNALQTLYGISNSGGSIVVSAPAPTPFVVTARTYNQTSNGTYGQFIPAVAPTKGSGPGDRPLQVLQLEQSSFYRTNVAFFELTGNPVTVQIDATVPDSKTALSTTMELAPNEFRQIPLANLLGGASQYNVRISVKVVGGTGRISSYGSVIDAKTQDPTYVPAQ